LIFRLDLLTTDLYPDFRVNQDFIQLLYPKIMKKHAGRSVDFVDSVDLVQIFEFKASKWQNQAINAK